jgi:D-alanyl-D-alanine carboxypeptidase
MIKNLKYFFLTVLISLPFWLGINLFENNLEEIFYLQEINKNPQIFLAQLNLNQGKETGEPSQKKDENFQIEAESAISVWLNSKNEEKILFEKEIDKVLPIASLTKLMTANVVSEYYPDLSKIVEISPEAVFQNGEQGSLKVGERLTIENLLYIMLIESSNDAAYSLSEVIDPKAFVDLMNLEAKYLGMENTQFVDPMGISPENRSTSKDLVILTKNLLGKPLIWEILGKTEFNLYTPDGVFHHKLQNTNELLGKIPEIIGGKTGYLPEAKECLVLVLKAPHNNEGAIINIILGSENNKFEEMEKLINYAGINY